MSEHQTASCRVDGEIDALIKLRIRDHVSEHEYLAQRRDLDMQRLALQASRDQLEVESNWFEPCQLLVEFCSRAADLFRVADLATKRLIVLTVGSNPVLFDRILSIEARKPFLSSRTGRSFPSLLASSVSNNPP